MFTARRRALQPAGRLRQFRTASHYSTEHHTKTGDKDSYSTTGNTTHHTGPVNEPLGAQLYIVLGLLSATYAVYSVSQKSEDGTLPIISKVIERYSHYQDKWAARNALHTAMVEQAAFDKSLFYNSKTSTHIDLRFREAFNTGSPWNVSAGRGWGDLDKVVAHYEKLNAEEAMKARAPATQGSTK